MPGSRKVGAGGTVVCLPPAAGVSLLKARIPADVTRYDYPMRLLSILPFPVFPLRWCLLRLCLLLLSCVMPQLSSAAEFVRLAVLVDPSGTETIASISRPERAAEFRVLSAGLSSGYTRDVHWLRFTLASPESAGTLKPRRLLLQALPPYLDEIQLFIPDPAAPEGFVVKRQGDTVPFEARDIPHRGFVFEIDFPDDKSRTFYLRLATTSTSLLVLRTWAPDEFIGAQSREYAAFGLYYGLLISLLLFHLWHGQWRIDPLHRNFILFIVVTILLLFGLNGFVTEFLAPGIPSIGHHWVSVCVLLTFTVTAAFYRRILDIDRHTPLLNAYFLVLQWLPAGGLVALLLGAFTEVARGIMFYALPMPLLGIVRSIVLWRQQRAGSGFLALAYAVSLASALTTVLSTLGLISGSFSLLYAFHAGGLISALAFSFALMSRFSHLQQERDIASEAARVADAARQAEALAHERQGTLLAMLTHELKTPLAVIRLAIDRLTGEAGVRRHASTAIADIARVIDRCRYADRLDHEDISVERYPCRIDEILADCRTQAPAARVDIAVPPDLPVLSGDAALLRTICANLLDNALKYSPPESVVSITVRHAVPAALEIDFANLPGAAGLPDPSRLFQRYHREPGAHAQTGSGLGLFLARQLSTLLGGVLRYHPPGADGRDGRLHFILRLPVSIT